MILEIVQYSEASGWPTRRRFPAVLAAAGALELFLLATASYGQAVATAGADAAVISSSPANLSVVAEDDAIRPFHINVPKDALADLRRRLAETRWPDQETVTDRS